ncbi:protein FLX-like 4 [Sesamum alatum]|uniref:Protein FLX-like 4 n=1 Tax=Sesamum alatum TaxID=300844 RepID=A0AAE1XPI9_9LAMI|nr:protein FLX-like 4 [Sesamum alatum]
MASRRNIPPPYDERFIQASEMIRRGPLPPALHPMEPLPPPVLLENKLVLQEAEIDQLARDNHQLASTHLALRQDLEAAQREAEKLREHIRSIQTEADIQIRILLEKISKLEADIGAGDSVKKELQEVHAEARSLVTARQELTAKIKKATKELENNRSDVKKIPEMHAELDCLRQEHQRLRKTFEYEKGLNIEKVEQMKLLEKDLIGMAEEVERLRAEVSNAEKRASAPIPYTGPYMNADNLYPTPVHGTGGYAGSFGGPHLHAIGGAAVEGMNSYAAGGFAVGPPVISGPAVGAGAVAAGNPSWGVMYNMSHTQT